MPPAPAAPPALRIAQWTTDIFAPQHLVTFALLTAPFRHPDTPVWHGLVAAVFVTGLPMALLEWMRRTGRVEDRHVSVRRKRTPILVASLLSLLTGLAVLVGSGVSSFLLAEVLAVLAGLIVCLLVTLWWKVSIHAAVGVFIALVLLPVHPAIALSALIGWSRIKVRGHTASQVLVGTLIGLSIHYGMVALS